MANSMRQPTLETLGLGSVMDIFKAGRLPVSAGELVDRVFGEPGNRGSLVISGSNGIVGAGKAMQLGSRLEPFGVTIVGLDFPGAPDGMGRQYAGLAGSFGEKKAREIMANIVQLTYDGTNLPSRLDAFEPRFLLESIPEILEIKKAHYEVFRKAYPGIDIRSVTSGFPSSKLGVGIAHPAFPHEINKVWEIVEPEPSAGTQLLWALGLIPMPVSDDWSFILDVLFCGVTLSALRYHEAKGMPFWKMDKFVRKFFGPNPFRAHDAIGAAGANFLTWSCLHHLSKEYGGLYEPADKLVYQKDSGQNWYPLNHFRPLVDWSMDEDEVDEFKTWILGPMFQMTSLLLHEKRGHLSFINAIGEICAQFRQGMPALLRSTGADAAIGRVEAYHELYPEARGSSWYPETFERMDDPEWRQLYVNAEHDGDVGVITINRESYNSDVDDELNRAVDWLKKEKIERVIVTGDFHLATQMVGADTTEFYPALTDKNAGRRISATWSKTARRLNDEFRVSVGFVNGKRCLGGFLELMMHCSYLVAVEGAQLGLPEVSIPVIPGMEGCHWPFRKADSAGRSKLMRLLLSGKAVRAEKAVGWLTDFAGPLEESIGMAWSMASGTGDAPPERAVEEGALSGVSTEVSGLPEMKDSGIDAARKAIIDCVVESCGATIADALDIQARHSAGFMVTKPCLKGRIGAEYTKTMKV